MIIGFVGKKQSGKTTACNIIKKHLPNTVQINFKDALVQEIKDNFPDLLREIADDETEWRWQTADCGTTTVEDLFQTKPPLMRALLQNYGTDVRRKEKENYWTTQWQEKVLDTGFSDKTILVDDVRFKNEAAHLGAFNSSILIRLERTDLPDNDNHQSEQEQKEIECDYVIKVGKGEHDKLEEELLKIIHEQENL